MNENNSKIEKQQFKVRISALVNIFFMIMMSLKAVSPYYSRNMSSAAFFLFFIGWLLSAFALNNWTVKLIAPPVIISSAALLLWQVLMKLIGFSTFVWGNYLFRVALYGIPFMASFVVKKYTRREKGLLLTLLLFLSAYNIVDNLILWHKDQNTFIGLYFEDQVANRLTNAGTTEFNAFCMFLIPTLFLLVTFGKKKITKWIGTALLLLVFYAIVIINPHATALLLAFLFISLLILVYVGGKKREKMQVTLAFGFLLIPLIYFLLPGLLRAGAELIPKEAIGVKLNQVASIISGAGMDKLPDGTSLAGRWRMAWVSLETFGSHFLFGIGEHGVGQSLQDFESVGFGGHSEFLDYLAKYGILGTSFLVSALYTWIKSMLSQASGQHRLRYITHVVWIMFVIYSFLNKSFKLELFFPIFVFFPIALSLVRENTETGDLQNE